MKVCKYCLSIPTSGDFCSKDHAKKFKKKLEKDLDRLSPIFKTRGYTDKEKK